MLVPKVKFELKRQERQQHERHIQIKQGADIEHQTTF